MSNSLNRVEVIGRVGKDPEIRVTESGMAITKLTVATSYKKKDGTEETEWFSVTMFDKLAQVVNNYVKKGNRIYIEGRLKTDSWEKEGVKHYKTGVIAQNIILLESKQSANSAAPEEKQYHEAQQSEPTFGTPATDGDEIPY